MRCIFSCLGDRKSRRKRITIPSKHQGHGSYEYIESIDLIVVEEEKTKDLNTDSLDSHEDMLEKNGKSEYCPKEKKEAKVKTEQTQAQSDSSMSSLFSYPINNRQKSRSSKEIDGSETGDGLVQQEFSDSLFSISISSKKEPEKGEKEVNSPLKVCQCPEKEKKIIRLNQSMKLSCRSNPTENVTQSIASKLTLMGDQAVTIPFRGENPVSKERPDLVEINNGVGFIGSEQSVKTDSNSAVRSRPGILGEIILMDYQEEKENVNLEQDKGHNFQPSSKFSEQKHNMIIGLKDSAKTAVVLNSTNNYIKGDLRRFVSTDGQEQNENGNQVITTKVPCGSFKKGSFKEGIVDTSLSSWLVSSERERDSPESIKNFSSSELSI